ncbi:MAG: hypothetical protein IPJ26_13160 [Bacteroidetes bacterium]|nr:hypothetical protein [Bacteroidota bacterium]
MKKLSALILLFLIFVSPLSASHLMGGEITWRCNGTGPNTGNLFSKLNFTEIVMEYQDLAA